MQATDVVTKAGVPDAEQFFEWAWNEQPRAMKAAMDKQAKERSTAGYRDLAKQFMENLGEIDPAAVLEADLGSGITATQVNGKVVLSIPGKGQMTFRDAVRAGVVKVSRR